MFCLYPLSHNEKTGNLSGSPLYLVNPTGPVFKIFIQGLWQGCCFLRHVDSFSFLLYTTDCIAGLFGLISTYLKPRKILRRRIADCVLNEGIHHFPRIKKIQQNKATVLANMSGSGSSVLVNISLTAKFSKVWLRYVIACN